MGRMKVFLHKLILFSKKKNIRGFVGALIKKDISVFFLNLEKHIFLVKKYSSRCFYVEKVKNTHQMQKSLNHPFNSFQLKNNFYIYLSFFTNLQRFFSVKMIILTIKIKNKNVNLIISRMFYDRFSN